MAIVLTNTGVTDSSIGISIGVTAGEAGPFTVEVSRAEDFASADSMATGGFAVSTAYSIPGLAAGVDYWLRARPTAGGAWSNVLVVHTEEPAAAAPYAGFSVDKSILVVPAPLQGVAANASVAGFPVTNLLNDDPASVWRTYAASPIIDFETSGAPIDTVALLGTNGNQNLQWQVFVYNTAADRDAGTNRIHGESLQQFRASSGLGSRPHYHGFYRTPVPYTARFWRLLLGSQSAWEFIARHLVVGLARSSVNPSRGHGSSPNDLGKMARNRFGTPDRAWGWRSRNVDFEQSWLTEAEFEAKWSDLDRLVGTTAPVLAVPNGKRNQHFHDRIAYGTIRQMRAEVMRSSRHLRTIEIDSLY